MVELLKKELGKLARVFVHPTFIFLTVAGNVILFGFSSVVYFLERDVNPKMNHFLDTLWWGATTITTVGYGDIIPVTLAGRILGLVLMFTGTVLFVTFTGVLAMILLRGEVERELHPIEREVREEEREQKRIEHLLAGIDKRLERLERR